MPEEKKIPHPQIRLRRDHHNRLKQLAERYRRSITTQLEVVLDAALPEAEKEDVS